MKTYHFISGLPRSGSTLLCNILAQNPRFYVSATSGILDIMFGVRNSWDNLTEFKAHPDPIAKKRVLRGIMESYYGNRSEPVIFDKSRGWVAYLEMAKNLWGDVKVLVPVRDIRDVLASFEKLWRKTSANGQVPLEREKYFEMQTAEGRANLALRNDQPVGLAYSRIKDALKRGHSDNLLFVQFENLTSSPKNTLEAIYDFLGEERFEHDFNEVKQVTWENDAVHGFAGLHDIRSKVEPMKPQWPTILGDWAEPLKSLNFWQFPNGKTLN